MIGNFSKLGNLNIGKMNYSVKKPTVSMNTNTNSLYQEIDYSNINDFNEQANDVAIAEEELNLIITYNESMYDVLDEAIKQTEDKIDELYMFRIGGYDGRYLADKYGLIGKISLNADVAGGVWTPEELRGMGSSAWYEISKSFYYFEDSYLIADMRINSETYQEKLDEYFIQYYGMSFLDYMTYKKYGKENVAILENAGNDLSNVQLKVICSFS